MRTLPLGLLLACLLPAAGVLRASAADSLAAEREEQTGTAITILFDNSGSMRDEHKIEQAKAAFHTWLLSVPAEYKFSLITFEGNGLLDVPLAQHTRDRVAQTVAQLQPRTSTPICGALAIAREQIEKRRREVTPYERQVVLIFTDGMENQDHRGIGGVQEDILALRAQSVEVVGIGFHGQGDYMNGVATRFVLAGDEGELRRGLAQVDAEIGISDDVLVSPSDLAALKTIQVAMPPTAGSALAQASAPTTAAAPAPAINSNSHFGWILALMIFALFFFVRGQRKAR